jgi:hypothetical protein
MGMRKRKEMAGEMKSAGSQKLSATSLRKKEMRADGLPHPAGIDPVRPSSGPEVCGKELTADRDVHLPRHGNHRHRT